MRVSAGSVVVAVLLLTQAVRGGDLSTIQHFERALRAAHRSGDLTYFEPLVCSAGVQPALVEDIYHSFGAHFDYQIRRIDVRPYYPLPSDAKTRWNLQPQYTLEVWYTLDRKAPAFPERYVLGKNRGQLQIAVAINRVHIPPSWIALGLTRRWS